MNKFNDISDSFKETEDEINIREIVDQYLNHWKWFVASTIIALIGAFGYLHFATKKYETTASIVLNKTGASSPALDILAMNSIGLGDGGNAKVADEITILSSKRLMTKVVEKYNLNISYFVKEGFKKKEEFYTNSPISISFLDEEKRKLENFEGKFDIKIINTNKFFIKGEGLEGEYSFNKPISSNFGTILINKNKTNKKEYSEITISFVSVVKKVESLLKQINITSGKENTSLAINFSLIDNIRERASLIIDELIAVYNEDSKDNENKLAIATSDFIAKRLAIIDQDLKSVDKDLEQFKSSNRVNNAMEEAKAYFESSLLADKTIVELKSQFEIIKQLELTMLNNKDVLLPTNVGINDLALNGAIKNYNELVLSKQDLSKSATEDNVMIQNIEKSIKNVRSNINSSLRIYKNNISTQIQTFERKKGEYDSQLSNLPQQEKGFRTIARQQQIIESIYLFLLQKREESEMKVAANTDNFRIVDKATSSVVPVAPKKMIILAVALVFGFIIPFAWIYISTLLNNKVQSKADVEKQFGGTILGELPKTKQTTIAENDRSPLAEAFRILRSSLNFLLPTTNKGKVIFVTSTTSGEGKTFTSSNMTQILGLTGKKAILIGADIRKPRILSSLGIDTKDNRQGLTDLLINTNLHYSELILSHPNGYKFDVLPAGSLPPNPSELLMSNRFEELLDELKNNYDYVIVDTAPMGLVTDTLIIAPFADVTIYVVRANYLDKRMLSILKEIYAKNKLKNLAVVVNDVDINKGYGYGYGYGEDIDKKNFFQKLFNK